MDGSGIIGIIRSLHNERYGTRFKETDAGRPDPKVVFQYLKIFYSQEVENHYKK